MVGESAPSSKRVILRPHIVYGPGDTTIAPRLKQSVSFGRFVALGDGTNKISLTHIDNLVQAIEKILTITPTKGLSIYNISDAETPTMREVLEVFKQKEGIKEPLFLCQHTWHGWLPCYPNVFSVYSGVNGHHL